MDTEDLHHKWARKYASMGFAIFPVHTIDEDGSCSCGKPCSSPGKHPVASLVPHGLNDALSDPKAADEWWMSWPGANIGIATGDMSGLLVVDIDGEAGMASISNLERLYGELEDTWVVETGGDGMHFYYRMPNADIRNSASSVGPGVDIRANGGYVIAPPSKHVSGNAYQWTRLRPTKTELADVPDWLLKKMAPPQALRSTNPIPKLIPEGMRNTWMASAAGAMRRKGFSEDAIFAALRIENVHRCIPPLDDRELARIARSIERYQPAPTFTAGGRHIASA